jgi:hypothetical protein
MLPNAAVLLSHGGFAATLPGAKNHGAKRHKKPPAAKPEVIESGCIYQRLIRKTEGASGRILEINLDRTYALAMNCLDFGRFLAGVAREKSSNCVSPVRNLNLEIKGLGIRG